MLGVRRRRTEKKGISMLGASLELCAPDDEDWKSTSKWTLTGH